MNEIEKQKRLAVLTAKIGYFFAKCDNDFDIRERNLLKKYVDNLREGKVVDDETLSLIISLDNKVIPFNEVCNESIDFINICNKDERHPVAVSLSNFINNIINADNIITDEEKKYYLKWKQNVLDKF